MNQTGCDQTLTGGQLAERRDRGGREAFRCARGDHNGLYVYLADRRSDEQAGRWRIRRRDVRRRDVQEIRRVFCATKQVHRDISRLLRDPPRILADLEHVGWVERSDNPPFAYGVTWQGRRTMHPAG